LQLRNHPRPDWLSDRAGANRSDEDYDLALRLGALSDSGFTVRQLAQFPLLVVASRSYVAANGSPDRPEMLRATETLIYSQQPNSDRLRFVDDAGKAVEAIVSGRVRASDVGFLVALAQAGRGVIVAPEFVVRKRLSDRRLLQLLPDWGTRDLSLQAILPHRSLVPLRYAVSSILSLTGSDKTKLATHGEGPLSLPVVGDHHALTSACRRIMLKK